MTREALKDRAAGEMVSRGFGENELNGFEYFPRWFAGRVFDSCHIAFPVTPDGCSEVVDKNKPHDDLDPGFEVAEVSFLGKVFRIFRAKAMRAAVGTIVFPSFTNVGHL